MRVGSLNGDNNCNSHIEYYKHIDVVSK